MPNLANITLAGHLGRDAELRTTKGGMDVLEWSMAVSSKRGGDETTNWYRCALFGQRASKIEQYLTKGKAVLVTGRLVVRDYQTKQGEDRYSLDVNVGEVEFLGGDREASRDDGRGASNYDASNPPADDDIPF